MHGLATVPLSHAKIDEAFPAFRHGPVARPILATAPRRVATAAAPGLCRPGRPA
jgi:hypothetical protein